MLTNILTEARAKLQEAKAKSCAHYEEALRAEKNHKTLGIVVVILSALVGSTVFAALTKETDIGLKIATGVVSIIAAVLAALQTFLKLAENSEKHRKAALAYEVACDKIDYYLLLYVPNENSTDNSIRLNALGGWTEITGYLQKAADIAPMVAASLYTKYEKKEKEKTLLNGQNPTSNLIIYYDGRKAKPGDISWENGRLYDKDEKKETGPLSSGTFDLDGQIMRITRTDNNGRFKLGLTSYAYNGAFLSHLPINPISRKTRTFTISCEVQSPGSVQHTLVFALKDAKTHEWFKSHGLQVNSTAWKLETFKLDVPADFDLALRIDDIEVQQYPSTIAIRNLMLTETL